MFLGQYVMLIALTYFVHCHNDHIWPQPGYLFEPTDTPFGIGYDIHVALVGFNGDGSRRINLEPHNLQESLGNSYASDRPVCVQTGRLLHVQNNIKYNVFHSSSSVLNGIERVIGENLERAVDSRGKPLYLAPPTASNVVLKGDTEDASKVALPVYDVDISKVDKQFAKALEGSLEAKMHLNSEKNIQPTKESVMFVLNPDKSRIMSFMKEKPDSPLFLYRYVLGDSSATRAWVSFGRSLTVDLTAMPQVYGTSQAGQGTVGVTTIPDIQTQMDYKHQTTKMSQEDLMSTFATEDGTSSPSVKFMSRLSSMLVSGVRKVFLNDIKYKGLDYTEKIVVPIVTFSNYDSDDAKKDFKFNQNVNRITKVLKKLLTPHQQLVVTEIHHSLYSHPSLAGSVFESIKESSVHVMGKDGKFQAEQRAFVDSQVLLHELMKSAHSNALLASIVQSGSSSSTSRTKGEQLGKEHAMQGVRSVIKNNEDNKHKKHRFASVKKVELDFNDGILPQRIIPVFIYSLVGLPPNIQFDKGQLAVPAAAGNMVLALQTPSKTIPSPFFGSNGPISINARDPTRAIIAALSSTIGGIVSPVEEFDYDRQEMESDYTWGMGIHPFSEFSDSYKLSKVYRDVAKRNGVVTRVSNAIRKAKKGLYLIGKFYDSYLGSNLNRKRTEKEEREEHSLSTRKSASGKLQNSPEAQKWLMSLIPDPRLAGAEHAQAIIEKLNSQELQSPFAGAVLGGFVRSLTDLDIELVSVSSYLQDPSNKKNMNDYWHQAGTRSAKFLAHASSFYDTVKSEIQAAQSELSCCRKLYTTNVSPSSSNVKLIRKSGRKFGVDREGKPVTLASPLGHPSDNNRGSSVWMYLLIAVVLLIIAGSIVFLVVTSKPKHGNSRNYTVNGVNSKKVENTMNNYEYHATPLDSPPMSNTNTSNQMYPSVTPVHPYLSNNTDNSAMSMSGPFPTSVDQTPVHPYMNSNPTSNQMNASHSTGYDALLSPQNTVNTANDAISPIFGASSQRRGYNNPVLPTLPVNTNTHMTSNISFASYASPMNTYEETKPSATTHLPAQLSTSHTAFVENTGNTNNLGNNMMNSTTPNIPMLNSVFPTNTNSSTFNTTSNMSHPMTNSTTLGNTTSLSTSGPLSFMMPPQQHRQPPPPPTPSSMNHTVTPSNLSASLPSFSSPQNTQNVNTLANHNNLNRSMPVLPSFQPARLPTSTLPVVNTMNSNTNSNMSSTFSSPARSTGLPISPPTRVQPTLPTFQPQPQPQLTKPVFQSFAPLVSPQQQRSPINMTFPTFKKPEDK